MLSITGLSIFVIIFFVFIAHHNVFGISFYEDSFDSERRDIVVDSILNGEHLILNVANDAQVTELEKLIPTCLALPDATLQKLLEASLRTELSSTVRRKRYADFMRRLQNNIDDDYQGYFNIQRRVSDTDKKVLADDLNKFLAKLTANDRSKLREHVQAAVKGGTATESHYLAVVVKFAETCPMANNVRRLLALRRFLDDTLMNE